MYFGAYIGRQGGVSPWRQGMLRHADWLGLSPHLEERPLADGRRFAFGWLCHPWFDWRSRLRETPERIVCSTIPPLDDDLAGDDAGPGLPLGEPAERNVIRCAVAPATGTLAADVPVGTPEQFYWSSRPEGVALGNDTRLLIRWAGLELDETGVFGLLQYGTIPAPFTLSRGVRRVPAGHMLELRPDVEPRLARRFYPPPVERPEPGGPSGEDTLAEALDGVLERLPESSVLRFSGGVDSGLIGARLVAMGRTDVQFITSEPRETDPDWHLARRMAPHLGVPLVELERDSSDVEALLPHIARDYSFPLGDYVASSVYGSIHRAAPLAERSRTFVDGTGGGLFNMGMKRRPWRNLYRVPRFLRRVVAGAYRILNLWRGASRLEVLGRVPRRSVQMSMVQAAVAGVNPLHGIAYEMPRDIRTRLETALAERVEGLVAESDPADAFAMLDVIHFCAGYTAAKCFEPTRSLGTMTVYPLMEPPVLRTVFAMPWDVKCEPGLSRAVERRLLARHVPEELAFHPKGPVLVPIHETFARPEVQEFLNDVVLSPQNRLLDFCEPKVVREMIELGRRRRRMSLGANNFLWALLFGSGWLSQLEL